MTGSPLDGMGKTAKIFILPIIFVFAACGAAKEKVKSIFKRRSK